MTEAARFVAIMEDGAILRRRLATEASHPVSRVVDAREATMRTGGTLFSCSNGGSTADAQRLATEWPARLRSKVGRPSWPAIALALDPAALSAGGNDCGFAEVFAQPLSGLGRQGDVPFGITTGGRSPDAPRALETARGMGIATVGPPGGDGGPALAHHPVVRPDRPAPAARLVSQGPSSGERDRPSQRVTGREGQAPLGSRLPLTRVDR